MSETPAASLIAVEKVGDAIVARPQVKLLAEPALKALKQSLADADAGGEEVALVVIDLTHVAVVPSLALGRLIEIAHACRDRGRGLKLAGLQPQIRKVFSVTRLDTIFQIADSVGDALRQPPAHGFRDEAKPGGGSVT